MSFGSSRIGMLPHLAAEMLTVWPAARAGGYNLDTPAESA